jgi:XTP/dITP diphosphohydrolase
MCVRLLIATRNAHKVAEIRAILGDGFRYLTLHDVPGAPAIVEDAATFEGNARKKAEGLAAWLAALRPAKGASQSLWRGGAEPDPSAGDCGAPAQSAPEGVPSDYVLADDSGLEVDALRGAPGVHSARFAAEDLAAGTPGRDNTPDAANNARLLRLLAGVPPERRAARFRCVLALVPTHSTGTAPPRAEVFEGVCEGRISFAPSGHQGFGYDPLFVPAGHEHSFAELGEEVKNRISHRANALRKLRAQLTSPPSA